MYKYVLLTVFWFAATTSRAAMVTGFGLGDFTVDPGSTSLSVSQTENDLTVSGSAMSGTLGGKFSPVDITGLSVIQFTGVLNGSGNDSPSAFALQLFDGIVFQTYFGNWTSFDVGTSKTVTLTLSNTDPGFDPSMVMGLQINNGGVPGSSVSFKADSVTATTAVPEPGTCILIAIALATTLARRSEGQPSIDSASVSLKRVHID